MTKFWGLVMDNGKRYTQKVSSSFCVTMAVLDMKGVSGKDALDKVIKLYLVRDQQEFLLGVFTPKLCQLPVKYKFGKGETITFYMEGGPTTGAKLHLTGYSFSEEESIVGIPFKGQQQSILVTEPKSADKAKKRVSIKESPDAQRDASTSEDDDDDDDEDDDDDGLGLDDEDEESEEDAVDSKKLLVNGLDDDDVQVIPQGKKKTLQSLIDEAASDSDDDDEDAEGGLEEEDDDDDDSDDDEEEDDEEDDDEDSDEEEMEIETSKPQEIKGINKKIEQLKNSVAAKNASLGNQKQSPNNNNQSKQNQAQNVRKSDSAIPKTPENQQIKQKMPSSAGHTPMKFYSKGGVMCQDIKLGTGAPAKIGRMVTVYYCGRLKSNNKKFDASESGPGFKFRLGKGEVIKGWDLGVEGMKVGGKRKLTIPANLAYGKRGAPPDIPPNSTLVFDVELRNVN